MRPNQVPFVCAHCAKAFTVKASRTKRDSPVSYCSRSCHYADVRRDRQQQIEQEYGKPIYDVLHELYYEQQMGIRAIARLFTMSDHTLWDWFDDLNIPRRSASDAVKGQWVANEQRRAATGQTFKKWAETHPDEVRANSVRANLVLQSTSPTSIEKILIDALDAAAIDYEFQYVVGNKFLCDFAFPAAMLIVECDGTYWHSTPKQRRRDSSKDAYLQACGYTVLRLSDKQLEQNVNSCVHAIATLLK